MRWTGRLAVILAAGRASRGGWRGNAGAVRARSQRVVPKLVIERCWRPVRAGSRPAASRGRPGDSDRVRLWRGVLELVAATLTGIVRDDILWRGFAVLDEEDLREWLGRHGGERGDA